MRLTFVGLVLLKLVISKVAMNEDQKKHYKNKAKHLSKVIEYIDARLNIGTANFTRSFDDEYHYIEVIYRFNKMSDDEIKVFVRRFAFEQEMFLFKLADSMEVEDEVLMEFQILIDRAFDLARKFPFESCELENVVFDDNNDSIIIEIHMD